MKKAKWIVSVCAAALLLVACLTAVFLLGDQPKTQEQPATQAQEQPTDQKIYWNINGQEYLDDAHNSTRPEQNGKYKVRFAVDGEQVDLYFESYALVNEADNLYMMGLEVDDNGTVTRVVPVSEFTGGIAVLDFYVQEVGEDYVLCNQLMTMKGASIRYAIDENTAVYMVNGDEVLTGMPTVIQEDCGIWAVIGRNGVLSHVFVEAPFEPSPVYWNVERMYDSTTQLTTRPLGLDGCYTFLFAVDGEQVELKTRDIAVASEIDAYAAKCRHLIFDEEGYIIGSAHAREATGGGALGSWYHVTELSETQFTCEKFSGSDMGSVAVGEFAINCKIFDVSGSGAYVGEPTELRLYDQVHCLKNSRGQVAVIFVVSRFVDGNIYWNVERMYDSTNKCTTRTPDAEGWYYFLMAVDGRQVTLKTQDPACANFIDARPAKCMVLTVDGDVITGYYGANGIYGGNTFVSWGVVESISGDGVVTAVKDDVTCSAPMADGCKTYLVTDTADPVGQETTLQVDDTIHALMGLDGKLYTIYVVKRDVKIYSNIYWNLNRSYDSAAGQTKRQPAEDGYYYLDFAVNGQITTLKTKEKTLVDKIDSIAIRAMGFALNGDTITKVYESKEIYGYTGGAVGGWFTVTEIQGNQITLVDQNSANATYNQSRTVTIPSGTPVYNVTDTYTNHKGEKTEIRVGDQLLTLINNKKQAATVFVVGGRALDWPVYWNQTRMYDSTNQCTTRTPDAEGWYYISMAVDGHLETLKTQDIEIVNAIDERAARAIALLVVDGVILRTTHHNNVILGAGTTFASWKKVTEVTESGMSVIDGDSTLTGEFAENCKVYDVTGDGSFGAETQLRVGDTVHAIRSADKKITRVWVISRTVISNDFTEQYCQACGEVVTWTGWDGASTPESGAHLYLTADTVHKNRVTVAADTTLCLDLCGYDLTGAQNCSRMFDVYGTLSIQDSGEQAGTVTATNPDVVLATVFYIRPGATFNLYGGNMTSTVPAQEVGIGVVYQGTMNMYGGHIYGGVSQSTEANKGGGNLAIFSTGVFNMYGGKISDGTAAQYGGNVFINGTSGTFNMQGGTITGGTAGIGGGIYSRADVILGAGASITGNTDSNLYLETGKIITVQGSLQENAVGVTLQSGTVFTGPVEEIAASWFTSDDSTYTVMRNGAGKLYLDDGKVVQPHIHSLGQEAEQTWEPWTGTWESGGYYYLTEDVEWSQVTIAAGDTLNLCLNGHNINGATSAYRLFDIYGTLNLCDHETEEGYQGTVTANRANTTLAPVFYVREGGLFNFYGGNMTASQPSKEVGIGVVYKATMNMYDGHIYGGVSQSTASNKGGGNLAIFSTGVFNMYGGKISDGTAAQYGGNVFINGTSGTFNMQGGTITGGTAGIGGGVYARADVILGAGANITGNTGSNLYLETGKIITVQGTLQENAVGVTLQSGTVFTGPVEEIAASWFTSDDSTYTVMRNGEGKLYLDDGQVAQSHIHSLGQEAEQTWEPWTGTWESGGHYYLTEDVEWSQVTIAAGDTLNLCLNGHNINGATSAYRLFDIYGTLNLCDHETEEGYQGTVTANCANTTLAPVFYVREGGLFNFYGGNITASQPSKEVGIGVVYKATMNMYDGHIYGGVSQSTASNKGGGNLAIFSTGVFNMYGGKISDGTAAQYGGNVFINGTSGTFNMQGGTITGGTAGIGGGIYSRADVILGAEANITGNTGSNLYLETGKIIKVQGILGENAVGVTLQTPGVFTNPVDEANIQAFFSDLGKTIFRNAEEELEMA